MSKCEDAHRRCVPSAVPGRDIGTAAVQQRWQIPGHPVRPAALQGQHGGLAVRQHADHRPAAAAQHPAQKAQHNTVQQPARQCGGLHLLCRAEVQPAAAAGCQLPAGIAQHLQFGVQLQRLRRNRGCQCLGRHNQPQRGQNVCPARRSRRQRCARLPENRHGTPPLSLQILPLVCPAFTPGAVVIAGISKNMQIF